MKRLTIICVLLCAGCATHQKIYTAPDSSKVAAATADLNVKVSKARDTAGKAKQATEEAQQAGEQLVDLGKMTADKLEVLHVQLPVQFQGIYQDAKNAFDAQMLEEGVIRDKLGTAVTWNTQLATQLQDAETARIKLQQEQNTYAGGAASLAEDATNERNIRIADEQKLHWYRMHWWGAWIALGAGVIACGVFAFLKLTGRLAISGATIASKLP